MRARLILAWGVAASAVSLIIERSNGDATLNFVDAGDWGFALLLSVLAAAGLVVVEGRRATVAGRLLLAMGAGTSTVFLAHAIAVAMLVRGHSGPGVQALVWLAAWLFVPAIGALIFVPAVWPNNKISSWLRLPTVLGVFALLTVTLVQAFAPDHLDGVGPGLNPVSNPLGVPRLVGEAEVITRFCVIVLAAYTGAVAVDLVLRYRGNPALRAELRPLVLMIAGLPIALATGAAIAQLGGGQALIGLLAAGGILLFGGLALTLVRAEQAVRRGEQAVAQRRRTVEMAERERRKLRRELHDGLGPGLAALRLQLDAVRHALPSAADEAATRLARVEDTLAGALEELRCIVDGLRPAALDELGLSGALTSQGMAISGPGCLAPCIDVTIDDGLPALPDAVEVALVRVSGEALANAVRHGAPSRCTVHLGWRDGHAILRIQDNGVGIHPGRPGHGLSTMRERVEELGGKFTVDSMVPHGTVVTAAIPGAR